MRSHCHFGGGLQCLMGKGCGAKGSKIARLHTSDGIRVDLAWKTNVSLYTARIALTERKGLSTGTKYQPFHSRGVERRLILERREKYGPFPFLASGTAYVFARSECHRTIAVAELVDWSLVGTTPEAQMRARKQKKTPHPDLNHVKRIDLTKKTNRGLHGMHWRDAPMVVLKDQVPIVAENAQHCDAPDPRAIVTVTVCTTWHAVVQTFGTSSTRLVSRYPGMDATRTTLPATMFYKDLTVRQATTRRLVRGGDQMLTLSFSVQTTRDGIMVTVLAKYGDDSVTIPQDEKG
ncbi:hypothetical protein BJY52DRAFT_1418375 [Lactarius psammicola]|nr:hypothetical protein BJY52DRAFT_1418375 [Lactarius psammicola]